MNPFRKKKTPAPPPAPAQTVVAGFALHPVSAWTVQLLDKIESPFCAVVDVLAEVARDKSLQDDDARWRAACEKLESHRLALSGDRKILETCFIFIAEPARAHRLLESGRREFNRAAADELEHVLYSGNFEQLVQGCLQHFFRGLLHADLSKRGGK